MPAPARLLGRAGRRADARGRAGAHLRLLGEALTGTLVLLRHGESTANLDDVFAGWLDVPLTEHGVHESRAAGRDLADLRPRVVHTSRLRRSVDTARLVATQAGWEVELRRDWRLNERHYGALQGLTKSEARSRYGHDQVEEWRRSVEVAPPPARESAMGHQLADRGYQASTHARGVRTESLSDVASRMAPYWDGVLAPELAAGHTVLVVSHGNALRVLLHLATGAPLGETRSAQVPTATPIRLLPELRGL